MGNLAQYRLAVVLFALGLLFVVSQVVGDGENPGAIDVAAKSIAKRLNSSPPSETTSDEPYEVAVTQSSGAHRARWFAKDDESDESGEPEISTALPPPTDNAPALPPPDDSMIRK